MAVETVKEHARPQRDGGKYGDGLHTKSSDCAMLWGNGEEGNMVYTSILGPSSSWRRRVARRPPRRLHGCDLEADSSDAILYW